METIRRLLLCLPILMLNGALATAQRVACVGDSITFGAQVADREHNAYPAQLERLLGPGWEVRNFGASGKTLLRDADTPYMDCAAFQESLSWQADITVVMLGTNDTCQGNGRDNWQHSQSLEKDALQLALTLLGEEAERRVILCSPTPAFPEANGLEEARRLNLRARAPRLDEVGSAVRRAASQDPRIDFLDLSGVLRSDMTVDGVHTTPFGARAIARRVAEALRTESVPSLRLMSTLAERGLAPQAEDFQGFRMIRFRLSAPSGESMECRLVEPDSPLSGLPWIWRARFFGHEPELDAELLSRGYHLAYCDVSQLFGSPQALERWDLFFSFCTELGLSKRVTLEGMSRGALVALNWGASRPENVAAIYLDNPVCDFRSWPGGSTGKRSETDWSRCLAAYGLTEASAANYKGMPLDRLESLAKAEVPLFLVLGSADEVVPPEENGELLARRYAALQAPIEVWRKPQAGHHPHGLHPVQPLLRALLRATGRAGNPAARPIGSAEYRGSPAGWGGGSWWDQLAKLRILGTQNAQASLVFLGDSITQGLSGSQDRVARPGGPRAFDRLFGARGALGLGLSGDRTEHLLYRIEHGALAATAPGVIVLMIGVNNVNAGHTGSEISGGLSAVVESLLEHESQAHVLLCGPFPCGPNALDPKRRALDEVHLRAARLGKRERVTYMDLRSLFIDEEGRPNQLMRSDHIHINANGQIAWLKAIEPTVQQLLGE